MMYGPEDFARESDVSRETYEDYARWFDLITRWNARINLVSERSLAEFWQRHALDSLQVTGFLPEQVETLLDFGSGGGFPGLAIGIHLKHRGAGHITMMESVGKKANFLRTVIRELDLPATVYAGRIEKAPEQKADVITARAFAPLPRLLTYAQRFWAPDTIALLHKGENAEAELTEAREAWQFTSELFPGRTDETGRILKLTYLKAKAHNHE